jgi:hypothetical protein
MIKEAEIIKVKKITVARGSLQKSALDKFTITR